MLKFNAKVGEWGLGLRFKSRIFRICLYLKRIPAGGIRASQGTFSSLLNRWTDFYQTCTDRLLGGRNELIRFW